MADVQSSQTGIIYSQDYNLKSLVLLSPAIGSFDLKNSMVEISYFEDIFSNFISGRVVVSETQGYIEKLHLNGSEYIRLIFTKASDKSFDIDILFRIYKISTRQLVGNASTEGYIIHFCSEELMLSEQYKLNKSYRGKKISDIISDITTTYLKVPSSKNVEIETTTGIYDFIIPNFKPFEAINWLSNYAQSAAPNAIGADMLFFENQNGFQFNSLQTLFNQNPYRTYRYNPKNIVQSPNSEVYNVITYEFVNTFDTLDAVNKGVFANRLLSVDPILQNYSITDYNYSNYFNNSTQLNKYPIVNTTKNRFGDAIYETPDAVYKVAFTNSGHKDVSYIKNKPGSFAKDIFIESSLPYRNAQLNLTNHNKLKLVISGDPGVTVGSLVNFELLSMEIQDNGKTLDAFYSGTYLVSAVKHTINIGSYKTTIEIIKESTNSSYVSPDNTSTIWKNTVQGET